MACIKVINNPQAESSFNLKFSDHGKKLLVKIIINSLSELTNMALDMKNTLPSFGYSLTFNWKGCPQAKDNIEFVNTMYKIFRSKKSPIPKIMTSMGSLEIESLVKAAKSYIEEYGSAPDLTKTHSLKGQRKIHNYLKTTLARPHLSLTDALLIAKRLSASS